MPASWPRGSGGLLALPFALLLLSGVDPRPSAGGPEAVHIEAAKKTILARIGLQKPPDIQEKPNRDVLEEMQKLYRQTSARLRTNQTGAPLSAAVHYLRLKVIPVAGSPSPENLRDPGRHLQRRYRLEASRTAELHRNVEIVRAELVVFKWSLRGLRGNQSWPVVTVKAHHDPLDPSKASVVTQEVSPAMPTLDLTPAVERWLAGPDPLLHLDVAFSSSGVASWPVGVAPWPPTLEVATQERGRRKPRQLDDDDEACAQGDGKCCLKSLAVSFEAIGWSDWVVAPRGYAMKFCQGSCPHNYKPASMHAQVKARIHRLSREMPAPCCVPAAYEPMVLMHYGDGGRVVTQVFEDMIVTRCHCA